MVTNFNKLNIFELNKQFVEYLSINNGRSNELLAIWNRTQNYILDYAYNLLDKLQSKKTYYFKNKHYLLISWYYGITLYTTDIKERARLSRLLIDTMNQFLKYKGLKQPLNKGSIWQILRRLRELGIKTDTERIYSTVM